MFFYTPANGGPAGPFAHLGREHAVAYDPASPQDEARDAASRLATLYAGEMDATKPDIRRVMEDVASFRRLQDAEEIGRMAAKALREGGGPAGAKARAKTDTWDSRLAGNGFFSWLPKKGLQFPVLKNFAERMEVAQAIHRTRIRQAQAFCAISEDVALPGFRLVHMDRGHQLSAAEEEHLRWIERFLLFGGRDFDPLTRRRLGRSPLTKTVGHLVTDGLTLDNAALELIGFQDSSDLRLSCIHVRDGSTFYRANVGDACTGNEAYAFQVVDGVDPIPFPPEQLALFTRNDDPWLDRNGYGRGEFESSLDTLNCILQALAHTKAGLTDNAIPKGILMAYGNFDRASQEAFKSAWQARQRGAANGFNLPILFSRGQQGSLQYLQTGAPFEEMAFARWISFQYSVMGGIYGVAPEEVGIESFAAEKSGLSGSDTDVKLTQARDKGLKPFMKALETFLSDEVVSRFAPWARLEFTGLLDEDMAKRREEQARCETINEMRNRLGMPPHPLGWFGDLPSDPGMMSAEFQRLNAVASVGEGRRVWGGLDALPDPALNNAPLNPSLQALYMQGLQGGGEEEEIPGDETGGGWDGQGDPGQDLPGGDEEGGGGDDAQAQASGPGDAFRDRMAALSGGPAPDGEEGGE